MPKGTPSSIRLLLSSVLNKNSAQRLQHIGDTRLFLDGTLAGTLSGTPAAADSSRAPDSVPAGRGIRGKLLTAALAAALLIAAVPAALYFRTSPTPAPQMNFDLALPGVVGVPAVSPDAVPSHIPLRVRTASASCGSGRSAWPQLSSCPGRRTSTEYCGRRTTAGSSFSPMGN